MERRAAERTAARIRPDDAGTAIAPQVFFRKIPILLGTCIGHSARVRTLGRAAAMIVMRDRKAHAVAEIRYNRVGIIGVRIGIRQDQ